MRERAAVEDGKAESVSAPLAEILAIILIGMNLTFQVILSRVESYASGHNIYLRTILRMVYRELMMLGFIGFLFTLVEISWHPPGGVVISFEFVHLLIFFLALLYMVVVVFSNVSSVRLSRHWKQMEYVELLEYVAKRTEYEELQKMRKIRSSWMWTHVMWFKGDLRKWWRERHLHDLMNFHDLRFQFIFFRKLPEDFNFTAYLLKVKATIYTHLVDIHWTFWATAFVFEMLDLLRRYLLDDHTNSVFDAILILTLAATNASLATIARWKIGRIYRTLTENPATYYKEEDLLSTTSRNEQQDSPSRSSMEGIPIEFEDSGSEDGRSVPSVTSPENISEENVVLGPSFEARAVSVDLPSAQHMMDLFSGRKDYRRPTVALAASDDVVPVACTLEDHMSPRRASIGGPDARDFILAASGGGDRLIDNPMSPSRNRVRRDGITVGSHAEHAMSFNIPLGRSVGLAHSTLHEPRLPGNVARSRSNSMVSSRRDSNMSELAANFPLEELEKDSESEHAGSDTTSRRSSIVRHHEDVLAARLARPSRHYPAWLLFFIPRLKRKAAPVEKLFWFASHRFFLWCIQLTLFVATLLASTMIAAIFVAKSSFSLVHWVTLGVTAINLILSLFQSASSLRTYTYVINASCLISEDLVSHAVGQVIDSRALQFQSEVNAMTERTRSQLDPSGRSRRLRKRRRNS